MKTSTLIIAAISIFGASVKCNKFMDGWCLGYGKYMLECQLYKLGPHGHGLNCESRSHQCKHVQPDEYMTVSERLEIFIRRMPDKVRIQPHELIACYRQVCAFVTEPRGKHSERVPGMFGVEAKAYAALIAHVGGGQGCSKCGEVQIGWPEKGDKHFIGGSLNFDWVHEIDIAMKCGAEEGLCGRFLAAAREAGHGLGGGGWGNGEGMYHSNPEIGDDQESEPMPVSITER